MEESIKIDSVFLSFNRIEVLRGICLEFRKNQVTGLLGRNGCGKSCLLKIITGQINPQSKHLIYKGKYLRSLYKEKGLINYLPQHEFHPKHIRLRDLLKVYRIEIKLFLQHYPFLEDKIAQKFFELSGGEKRLVEVLLVLESNSKFSILDEPFSHLMPVHIDLVKDRINELKSRKGILITDHQYRNVVDISDDLYLMKDGILKKIKEEEDLSFYGYIH